MRQHPLRDSRGIQAGKGSSWGKGQRNESYKKGGLRAGASVISWDKYGHWSQRDRLEFQLHRFLCGLGTLISLSELQLLHLEKEGNKQDHA